MAMACCCASDRFPEARWPSSKALCIRPWGSSENNRRPKFYRHTPAGRTRTGYGCQTLVYG